MDREAFEEQIRYLKRLKSMRIDDLRKEHDLFFKGKLSIESSNYRRPLLEKRLFTRFCLLHWHLDKTDKRTIKFAEIAREVLSRSYADEYMMKSVNHQEERYKIEAMDEDSLDRALADYGLYLDASLVDKQEALSELSEETDLDENEGFKKLRTRNKYYLTQILQKHPRLTWAKFQEMYGRVMPQTSENTFYKTKAKMRKEGYDLPRLR